jgi:hypothetical protein
MHKLGACLYAVSMASNPDHPDVVVQEVRKKTGILSEYKNQKEVFSKTKAQAVAEHGSHNFRIDLVEGKKLPRGPIYHLSAKELETLRNYLHENLAQNPGLPPPRLVP